MVFFELEKNLLQKTTSPKKNHLQKGQHSWKFTRWQCTCSTWMGKLQQNLHLVGGWTNPSWKYESNWIISGRGENIWKKNGEKTPRHSLKLTAKGPENWWLEFFRFPFLDGLFSGGMLVSGRVCLTIYLPNPKVIPFTFPFIHDSKPICNIMEKASQEGETPFITWFLPIFQDHAVSSHWKTRSRESRSQYIPIHGRTKYYWDTRDHWNLYHVRI